jgi:hypothetical protein
MQIILNGFTQDMGFRVFAFERVGPDRIRTEYTVRADLALIRTYNIQMQELPLLCRSLLERHEDAGETRTLTFTEEEMRIYVSDCETARRAAAQKRKPPRRPPGANLGTAWRGHTLRDTAPAPAPSSTQSE